MTRNRQPELVEAGAAALAAAEWALARRAYERAVAAEPGDPEALDGLGRALFWCGDPRGAVEHRRRAFALFRARGEHRRAAACATYVAGEERIAGRLAAWRGWLARAERLLDGNPTCPEAGWILLERAKAAPDPEQAARHAAAALEIARKAGDADLEIGGLSQLGLALVSRGEIERGMELIDEAMAEATSGEAADPLAIGDAACTTLVACDRLADFARAAEWARYVVDFTRQRRYTPLAGWCRTVYAGVLTVTGEWPQAESELREALRPDTPLTPAATVSARARLAELRLRQGRLEEAARLIDGHEDHPLAVPAACRLALARGDAGAAAAMLAHAAGRAGGRDVALATLLPVEAEVRLATGDLAGAAAAVERLRELGRRLRRENLVALAELAAARVSRVTGDGAELAHLDLALERFGRLTMPLEEGRARMEAARALEHRAPELAVGHARAALAIFEQLGAALDADEAAAQLRRLGSRGRPMPHSGARLTRRERQVLALVAEGCSNGEIAERLFIAPKTAEHHVGRILGKLGVRNRAEAAAHAVRQETAS